MNKKAQGKQSQPAVSAKEKLSANDLQELQVTFDLFDPEKTGVIDPKQIQKILQELGLDRRNESVAHILSDLLAKNKGVTFDDFLEIVYNRLGDPKSKEGLQKIFDLYDVDQNGSVDLQKFKRIALELGQTMDDTEIIQMMHNAHILNKTQTNQQFTFQEFYEIVTKKKY